MRQRVEDYDDRNNFLGVVASEDRVAESSDQRRMLPMALVTAVVMAVFAGGLWFAYVQGARHATAPAAPGAPAAAGAPSGGAASTDNAPLIRADQRPLKVKPDQPGGMEVPDRDKLVFNEKAGGPPVEKLLPPPEAPAPLPSPPPKQATAAPPVQAAPPTLEPAPAPAAAPQPVASKPVIGKPGPAEKKVASAAVSPIAAQAGGVRVQLGSLRSPDAAREEWQRLKRINSDLLGQLTAVAVRADVPDKGVYYRIEAGPVGDPAAAGRLCSELKKRKLGCTIVR